MIAPMPQRASPPLVRSFEERPLFPVALYYLLGIVLGAHWPIPVNFGILAAAALTLLLAALYLLRRKLLLGALALALVAGVTAVSFALPAWAADPWAPPDPVTLSGRIVQAKATPEEPVQYVLDDVTLDGQPVDGRVRVTTVETDGTIRHGFYTATASLSRPNGTAFYAAYNDRGYQMRQGVRFYAWATGNEVIREDKLTGPAALLDRFQNYANHVLYTYLPRQNAALVDALLSGNRDAIDPDTADAFNRLGVAHLLAVSGLNITLTAGSAWLLLRRLRAPLALAAVASVAVLLGYVAYAGLSASVLRAAAMWLTVLLARLTARRYDGLSALSAAVLLVLGLDPLDLFDVGFQLSFAAIAAIMLWMGPLQRRLPRKRWLRYALETLGATLTVQAMTLPILLYYFNNLPLWSPLANLVMVPWSYLAQLGGMALLAVGWVDAAARAVGGLLGSIAASYQHFAQWLARHATVLAVASPPLWLALGYGGAALALSPSVLRLGRRGRLGVAAVVVLLALAMVIPWSQPLAYRCDAAVLREADGMSLFWQQDGRPQVACAGSWYNACQYARKRGVAVIDDLFFLSADPPPDGAELKRMAVGTVVVPDSWMDDPAAVAFLEDARSLGIAVREVGSTGLPVAQQDCMALRVSAAGRSIAYVPWAHAGSEAAVRTALEQSDFAVLDVSAKRAAALGADAVAAVALSNNIESAAARAYNMEECASLALMPDGETPWAGDWTDGLQGNFR